MYHDTLNARIRPENRPFEFKNFPPLRIAFQNASNLDFSVCWKKTKQPCAGFKESDSHISFYYFSSEAKKMNMQFAAEPHC